jgi:hypothetical protein
MHGFACLVPFFFSWRMLAIHFTLYLLSGLGITYSYHRQLSHRSFRSPKWLEYAACYCGMMAMQGGPLEWAGDHRYHHLHTETALDPHSSYEGFYCARAAPHDSPATQAHSPATAPSPHDTSLQFDRATYRAHTGLTLAHSPTLTYTHLLRVLSRLPLSTCGVLSCHRQGHTWAGCWTRRCMSSGATTGATWWTWRSSRCAPA